MQIIHVVLEVQEIAVVIMVEAMDEAIRRGDGDPVPFPAPALEAGDDAAARVGDAAGNAEPALADIDCGCAIWRVPISVSTSSGPATRASSKFVNPRKCAAQTDAGPW